MAVGIVQLVLIRRADTVAGFATSQLLLVAIIVQAVLGIATLLLVVPLWLALVHQGGAIVVLLLSVLHLRDLYGGYPIGK